MQFNECFKSQEKKKFWLHEDCLKIQTLEDLSKKYKISRERIRQIETKAFEKLQKSMLKICKIKKFTYQKTNYF